MAFDSLYIGSNGSGNGRVMLRPGQYRTLENGQIELPRGFYSAGFAERMSNELRSSWKFYDVDLLPKNWASDYKSDEALAISHDAVYTGPDAPSGRVLLRPGQYRVLENGKLQLPKWFSSAGFMERISDGDRNKWDWLNVELLPRNWASVYESVT